MRAAFRTSLSVSCSLWIQRTMIPSWTLVSCMISAKLCNRQSRMLTGCVIWCYTSPRIKCTYTLYPGDFDLIQQCAIRQCAIRQCAIRQCAIRQCAIRQCAIRQCAIRQCVIRQCAIRQCVIRQCAIRQCVIRQCAIRQCAIQQCAIWKIQQCVIR